MLTLLCLTAAAVAADPPPPVDRLRVPQGFRIALYAHPVPGARSLALGARGTVFVEPLLVVEVEFRDWTRSGTLRAASFKGLRDDVAPERVVREG